MAPSIALTGTTGASGRDAATTYLASLPSAERHSVIQAPAPAPLLLTPRFRASRHVVALVPSSDAPGTAVTVVKMSRLADDGDVTRREAAALAQIADGPAELRDTAPRLIDVGAPWGLPTLVETAVVGRPLDPTTVRREPDGAIAAVSGWLERLACLSGASAPAASRLDRLLERPMSTFAATVANPDADDVMISSTRAAIERLRSAVLPVAFEHGDASHPNLFRRDDGSVAAVDWECAEPDGLPAYDLTTCSPTSRWP